jgi:hypothetical protein
MTFDTRYQVKQYVGLVTNERGSPFMVFKTGNDQFYLFCQCFPGTMTQTGLQFPVKKTALANDVKRALANGCSYDARPVIPTAPAPVTVICLDDEDDSEAAWIDIGGEGGGA